MSHSYKKTPYCGDKKGKDKKRFANKAVRTYLKRHPHNLLKNNEYKKYYCSWNICDYYWIIPWQEFYNKWKDFGDTKKELHKYWYRHYRGK